MLKKKVTDEENLCTDQTSSRSSSLYSVVAKLPGQSDSVHSVKTEMPEDAECESSAIDDIHPAEAIGDPANKNGDLFGDSSPRIKKISPST